MVQSIKKSQQIPNRQKKISSTAGHKLASPQRLGKEPTGPKKVGHRYKWGEITPFWDPWDDCIFTYIYWLVVEPTHLKNMLVKLDHFPR